MVDVSTCWKAGSMGSVCSGEAPSPVVFGIWLPSLEALPKELWSGTPVMAKDSVDWEIQVVHLYLSEV